MDEEAEKDDDLIEPLGVPVYGKSLLYLVSNAFEPETKKAAHSRTGRALPHRPGDHRISSSRPAPHRLEFSHAKGKPHNPATHARMHGCFDNDDATMRSVLETITGARRRRCRFPIKDEACDKASSRALGVGCRWRTWQPGRRSCSAAGRGARRSRRARDARSASASTAIRPARWPAASATRRPGREALRGLRFDVTTRARSRRDAAAGARRARTRWSSRRAPGDSLVFQYSGHGTQAEDLNGDESDRYDEALVPIDYTSGALLLDDDLADVYRRLPDGAVLTLFMDCCHSGTNSRFAPIDRSAAARRRAPTIPRADARSRGGAPAVPRPRAGRRRRPTPRSRCPGVIHFAACLDNQFAYESGGQGHFTRIATAALAAAVARGQTNEDFGSDVAAQVIGLGRPQTPRLMRLPAGLDRLRAARGRRRRGGRGDRRRSGRVWRRPGATLDDRAMAEWCLQFFEAGAAHWRQRLGR